MKLGAAGLAALALCASACAHQRGLYAGPVATANDKGVVITGKEKRPIECYSEPGDYVGDLEAGRWVIVEGQEEHSGPLATGLHGCQVLAQAKGSPTGGAGLELEWRKKRGPPPPESAAQDALPH